VNQKRRTGEVYLLPPEPDDGDPKYRLHVLLTDCDTDNAICTLAFCSTQATEAQFGASNHLVDPSQSRYGGTGFSEATYVYVSRLIARYAGDLTTMKGRLVDDMALIRDELRAALGLQTGTALEGKAKGSLRGQVVVLSEAYTDDIGTEYAIILTSPRYARERSYQIVVPVYDDSVEPEAHDVQAEGGEWLKSAGVPYDPVIIAVPFVQSVYQPTDIAQLTGVTVDTNTISEIEDALRYHFNC
jgi:hypothetical protein